MTSGTLAQSAHDWIQDAQGLVISIAQKVHRRLPSRFEVDDLVGYGQVGLAEAARDFDPSRGGSFTTFAYYRIRGAIYDGVARMSGITRDQYRKIRRQKLADEVCQVDEPNTPSDVTTDVQWLRRVAGSLMVSLLASETGDASQFGEAVASESEEPSQTVVNKEVGDLLRELIETLPGDAGQLIRDVYFGGRSLQEAGEALGVRKSWASRLHAKTLERLGRSLRLIGISDP